jgi:glycosyltransferase involved in cell wall biosynthesis
MQCIGFGDLFEQRIQHPSISHLGFKQPSEIESYVLNSGVYVLPSVYEPWGVAVHEMALCALPLVLSDKVGAASMFLKQENGFSFKAGDQSGLTEIFTRIMRMKDEELWAMSEASYQSGMQLSSNHWAGTMSKILND